MNHPNDTPGDDFDPVACEAAMARHRLITIDPADQVAAVAAERDALRALLDRVAAALGCPDQLHTDLPDSVEALRLHRDHLEAAARDALAIGRRP